MEEIPLPSRRARNKRPINRDFEPRSFPGQRFAVRLDYNEIEGFWTVEFEHLRREFTITQSVATPLRAYSYLPYLVFLFADPAGKEQEVTPENLGEDMKLWVLPGPSGQQPEDQ